MKHIERLFPGKLSPNLLSDEEFRVSSTNKGDLTSFTNTFGAVDIDPMPLFSDTCNPTKHPAKPGSMENFTSDCDRGELSVLIFRDSFFTALTPYFSRKFKHASYAWGKFSHDRLEAYINKEKPDIVIEERVERTFPYVPSAARYSETGQ